MILTPEEYEEITGIVFDKIQGQLDGPMFVMEEFEDKRMQIDEDNSDGIVLKKVSRRKVCWSQ